MNGSLVSHVDTTRNWFICSTTFSCRTSPPFYSSVSHQHDVIWCCGELSKDACMV